MSAQGLNLAKAALLGAAFLLVIAGCAARGAADSFGGSRAAVVTWARARGFAGADVSAGGFRLLALTRARPAPKLTIYIEGDGAAWANSYLPPRDPTPLRPIALALAAADSAEAVAYLGRPCQYLDPEALTRCDSGYWTGRRFAPEVIAAFDQAVSTLKAGSGATSLRLVGYSGGGVIAALLAGRRSDVGAWASVAAPLAVGDWVKWHDASPLGGSLDPAQVQWVRNPGVYFAGSADKAVPAQTLRGFVDAKGGRLVTVPGFDHECCWVRDWPQLLKQAFPEGRKN